MSQSNSAARAWRTEEGAALWLGWPESVISSLLAVDINLHQLASVCDELLATRLLGSIDGSRRTRLFLADEGRSTWTLGAALCDGAPETSALGEMSETSETGELVDRTLQLPLTYAGETVARLDFAGLPDVHPMLPADDWGLLASLAGAAVARQRHGSRIERSQVALASTTRYLDRLLGLISDGVVVLDLEGRILAVNSTAQAWLDAGIDAIGRPLHERLAPECGSAVLALVHMAARQASPVVRSMHLRLADDGGAATRTIEISVERIQPDPESSAGLLVCLRDLSALGEEAWFQRGEEVRSAQMTALADSLSRPMAAMRAYLSLLRDEISGTGRPVELWNSLDLQAEWVQSRLDTLGTLDQFRVRQPTWRDLPVNPNVLLDRALARVRTRLELRGVTFDISLTEPSLRALVDVEKCVLVLSHLLDELAHLMGGPGRITAELRHRRSPTSRVQLTLRGVAGPRPASASLVQADYPRLAAAAGVEETRSLYAMPLARSVVHRYGGTLLWDRPEDGVAAITLTLPCAPEETPS